MNNEPIRSVPVAPFDLREKAIGELLEKGLEPSPDNLLAASRHKGAPLHNFFFVDISESTWIEFGRREAARRIINSAKIAFTHGVKTLEVRQIEFLRQNGVGRWATTEEIVADPELLKLYMDEIMRLQDASHAKMARVRELME